MTSLAVITSKKMSLCCSKLIWKVLHQKPCNTQIHISTEVKLSEIKLIPFTEPPKKLVQKLEITVSPKVPSLHHFLMKNWLLPVSVLPQLGVKKIHSPLLVVLYFFPTTSQMTCNFQMYYKTTKSFDKACL